LLALLAVPVVEAAQTQSGSIDGVVTDPGGGVVPAAAAELKTLDGGRTRRALSDGHGRFRFDQLEAGPYLLTVERAGLAPHSGAVDVAAGQTSTVHVTLAAAAVSEVVTVSATRLATPVSSIPNTVTIVDADAIRGRTAISDDLASVLESSVPGFAPSLRKLSGRGETLRGRNPLYAINGVPQHSPLRDGERDGHTIDLDFVERIEVIHGANAIQGIGATGGIVNLVTKSPRQDGSWTHDVKLSTGNDESLDSHGWSSKLSYLLGKRVGALDVVAGVAVNKRGMFLDARGEPIGLYPTQGDIMDSTSRGLYVKAGYQFTATRRLEAVVNDFRLERDGDFVTVPGNRAQGILTTAAKGDPRPVVGDPAVNDATTISIEYRDKRFLGGDASLQVYAQDFRALFEGGTFAAFALDVGGPAFLDQSAIATRKLGAKFTYAMPQLRFGGITPTVGLDLTEDRSDQSLARTGRTWVPETRFREAGPFLQLQRLVADRVLVSGGARLELARLQVDDFTTLPSSRSTFVKGGHPSFVRVLPNVGAVAPINERISVYSSYSEGFTMPDVGRVLRAVNVPGQDVDTLVDLEPVVASNVEAGVAWKLGLAQLQTAYYRSVSRRGSLLDRDAEGIFHVRRQPTTIDGIDVALSAAWREGWSAGGNFAWLRGRYDSDADGVRDTDLDGLNIAPNRLNGFVQGSFGQRVTGRLQLSTLLDRSFHGRAAPEGRDFGGYTTLDSSLGIDTRAGLVRLGVENLLDRQYVVYFSQVDTAGTNDTYFAGPGRAFTISFERRF
jgi:iron complex outermembrane receptor protein